VPVTRKKTILFELNEVPLRIIDAHCAWHPSSSLARYLPRCFQFEAHCEDVGPLTPWRTWPSLHRGVRNDQHGISHFGQKLDDADRAHPPLWRILASHGVRSGVFGSLHSYPPPASLDGYAFYFPDTFAPSSECFPRELEILQHFNLIMSRRSGRNVDLGVPWGDAIRLLSAVPRLGIRASTLFEAARQLASEKVQPWRATRRRTLQPVLAFDAFERQLRSTLPDFATFFTNHVASSMHRYWAACFPEDYEVYDYDDAWRETYRGEIAFAMYHADLMLARLFAFVDRHPDYQLVIATSMGQRATRAQPVLSQLYLTDLARFMARMDVGDGEWRVMPAMQPDINVFVSAQRTDHFRERVRALRIDGDPLRFEEDAENQFFSLIFGHTNLHDGPRLAELDGQSVPFAELGLEAVMIDDASGTCAYHVPEGALLVYRADQLPAPSAGRPRVSFLELAPWLLENFAVPLPPYMRASSLASHMMRR
jgi:hypothetical protein